MTDHTFFSFPPRLVFYILFRINSSSEESFPSLYAWKSTFSSSQSYFFTSQPIIRSLPAAHHGEVCEDLSSVGSYRSPCFVYNFFRNVYFFFMGSDPNVCQVSNGCNVLMRLRKDNKFCKLGSDDFSWTATSANGKPILYRVVKVPLPQKSKEANEYLVTNIINPSISPSLLYNLYFERWGISKQNTGN